MESEYLIVLLHLLSCTKWKYLCKVEIAKINHLIKFTL